jgi:hypothetical protein
MRERSAISTAVSLLRVLLEEESSLVISTSKLRLGQERTHGRSVRKRSHIRALLSSLVRASSLWRLADVAVTSAMLSRARLISKGLTTFVVYLKKLVVAECREWWAGGWERWRVNRWST